MTNKEKFIDRVFISVCQDTKVYRYNHVPPFSGFVLEEGSRVAKFDPMKSFQDYIETNYGLYDISIEHLYKKYLDWVRNRKRCIVYSDGSSALKEYIQSKIDEGR